MEFNHFENPVSILVGLGFPRAIHSVVEAHQFLVDWPPSRRSRAYSLAMNACKAAMGGEIEAETARTAFIGFAHRHSLLLPASDAIGAKAVSRTEARGARARR